ncbi:hypothetical protein GCM10022252_27570 [Streptosporangium oxazolinicum]|uniref:Uncharacterized protein n=1 Tax=Streptosporangium oxazolinicum TaxID=909287 RepID=A0ABP8AT81_9ACTN
MAWEWVSPVATGATGVVGVVFTWWAGHQGRKHAEQVALQNASAGLRQAREARQAAAYLDVLTTVEGTTTSIGLLTSVVKFLGEKAPPLPDPGEQVAASAKMALYGSQAAQVVYAEWLQHVGNLLNNHEMLEVLSKNDEEDEEDDDPSLPYKLQQQQEVSRKAMDAAAKKLQRQMNSELTS